MCTGWISRHFRNDRGQQKGGETVEDNRLRCKHRLLPPQLPHLPKFDDHLAREEAAPGHNVSMNTDKTSVEQEAKAQAQQARPWLERLARLGFLSKGLVYATVGVLALRAAFGSGGQTTDTQGAVQALARAPFGQVLLALLSLGLISYGLWRFVQAWNNPADREGAKGVVARSGFVVSGVIHLALAVTAVGLLVGSSSGGGSSEQGMAARLLAVPFGRWLVGLVGLAIIGMGVYQLVKAYRADFRDALKTAQMSQTEQRWAVRAGRVGYAARGIVFALMGSFFIQAALQAQASEARGLGGALRTLQRQPYGPFLLGAVALGFVLYGVYMAVEARYRNIYAE